LNANAAPFISLTFVARLALSRISISGQPSGGSLVHARGGVRRPGPRIQGGLRQCLDRAPGWTETPSAAYLFGLGVHHAVRARICLECGRLWQAEYWIRGVRDQAFSLACRRRGLNVWHGRGYDDLPAEVLEDSTLLRSVERQELLRALKGAINALSRGRRSTRIGRPVSSRSCVISHRRVANAEHSLEYWRFPNLAGPSSQCSGNSRLTDCESMSRPTPSNSRHHSSKAAVPSAGLQPAARGDYRSHLAEMLEGA